jgi:hypothetical protein
VTGSQTSNVGILAAPQGGKVAQGAGTDLILTKNSEFKFRRPAYFHPTNLKFLNYVEFCPTAENFSLTQITQSMFGILCIFDFYQTAFFLWKVAQAGN